MDHGRLGHERLRIAGAEHVDRENPVLGVGNLAKRYLPPRGTRHAGVGVGEEAASADQLDRLERRTLALVQALDLRGAVGRQRAKPALELHAHRRRGLRTGPVRAVDERHVVRQREAPQQTLQPALVGGHRVLRQERHVRAGRGVHQKVARPAV